MDTSTSTAILAVPFFKKKSKATSSTVIRKKRSLSPEPGLNHTQASSNSSNHTTDLAKSGTSVVRLARKEQYNPLKQATSKRRKQSDNTNDSDDALDDALNNGASSVAIAYRDRSRQSRRSASPSSSQILSGAAALAKTGQVESEDGLYHGAANYQAQLPVGSSKFGPIKGPSASIKTITLVDYQPDVCKDYKETGWCGFGDSCKFLHDRGDYLHGWQLDNMYLSDKPAAETGAGQETLEEELPFACIICRDPFSEAPHDPVVTRCGHYFGASCAIKRFKKTPKCYACGAATGGMFNKATKLLERKEKNQKERIKRMEEAEGGVEYEKDEGGVLIEGLAEEGD